MAVIRPCADLRNNYNEISKICHDTREPIYITKNGSNDLVVLSDEVYESMKSKITETTEEKIDKLISEKFNKYYSKFEDFQKDVWKNIEEALKEVDSGKAIPMEKALLEMEAKNELNKKI